MPPYPKCICSKQNVYTVQRVYYNSFLMYTYVCLNMGHEALVYIVGAIAFHMPFSAVHHSLMEARVFIYFPNSFY